MNARISLLVAMASLIPAVCVTGQEPASPPRAPNVRRAAALNQPSTPAGPLVTLEVLLIDYKSGGDAKEGTALPTAAQLMELEKQAKLDRSLRVRLSTVSGRKGTVQMGERVPVATARVPRGFGGRGGDDGGFAYSYTIENIGTIVSAQPQVEDGAVVVDLQIERSSLAETDRSADEPRDQVGRQKTVTLTSQSTMRLKPGEPALGQAFRTSSGQESSGQYIVVTAQVEPGGAESAAATRRDHDAQMRVFALKTAKAAAMLRVLREVYSDKPLKMSGDETQNAIIVLAPAEQMEAVAELIQALDQERNK